MKTQLLRPFHSSGRTLTLRAGAYGNMIIYKYKDELKMIFLSSNLVSGMFQRLDKSAFASVLIIGEDNDNEISGVWVMRGLSDKSWLLM